MQVAGNAGGGSSGGVNLFQNDGTRPVNSLRRSTNMDFTDKTEPNANELVDSELRSASSFGSKAGSKYEVDPYFEAAGGDKDDVKSRFDSDSSSSGGSDDDGSESDEYAFKR